MARMKERTCAIFTRKNGVVYAWGINDAQTFETFVFEFHTNALYHRGELTSSTHIFFETILQFSIVLEGKGVGRAINLFASFKRTLANHLVGNAVLLSGSFFYHSFQHGGTGIRFLFFAFFFHSFVSIAVSFKEAPVLLSEIVYFQSVLLSVFQNR